MRRQSSYITVAMVFVLSIALQFVSVNLADAQSEADLRAETEQLEQDIANNEAVLDDLGQEIDTLNGKLAQLAAEIGIAEQKIQLTDKKIAQLTQELADTEAELERQKAILNETLITLYIEGDVSTVELIFSSDNFGEFFQEQQYLERLKVSVQESADQVAILKDQIAAEKKKQEELQEEQKQNRDTLASRRTEEQTLLDRTQGEEAAYQQIV